MCELVPHLTSSPSPSVCRSRNKPLGSSRMFPSLHQTLTLQPTISHKAVTLLLRHRKLSFEIFEIPCSFILTMRKGGSVSSDVLFQINRTTNVLLINISEVQELLTFVNFILKGLLTNITLVWILFIYMSRWAPTLFCLLLQFSHILQGYIYFSLCTDRCLFTQGTFRNPKYLLHTARVWYNSLHIHEDAYWDDSVDRWTSRSQCKAKDILRCAYEDASWDCPYL